MNQLSVKILTLFPELFPGPLGCSVIGKALENKLWSLEVINIRDFAEDKHKAVDFPPIGGGGGMVMKPDVLGKAIDYALKDIAPKNYNLFYLSPRGKILNQKKVHKLLSSKNIILICGRFEGIDQRVIDHYKIEEISIGDYVLSGGEIAAYAVVDSCVRLIPGVTGNKVSIIEESFAVDSEYENLIEYPQYTKPNKWKQYEVPSIMLSGNHAKIKEWQLQQAQKLTKKLRPDLWKTYNLAK
jgi:tRNA (guanine37-N1)-methyltransferase